MYQNRTQFQDANKRGKEATSKAQLWQNSTPLIPHPGIICIIMANLGAESFVASSCFNLAVMPVFLPPYFFLLHSNFSPNDDGE